MSDTYSYEVLEPGGHARLVGNVLDRISEASANPASAVGSSRAMLGDAETASWTERTTAADGAALIESVKGNTLRWNQLVKNGDFSNGKSNWSSVAGSWDVQDGTAVISVTGTYPALSQYFNPNDASYTSTVSGHKYLAAFDCALTSSQLGVRMSCITYDSSNANVGAVYTPYGQTISSSMTRYGGIFTATGAANHFIFNANGCASGDAVKFDNLQLFDLTAMFGAGNEPATVAEFEALFPEPYYPYDPGSLLPVRMEGVETTGDGWTSQRTISASTYFPDGMRSAGSVYDELRADAAVTRVGAVDLGTLTWTRFEAPAASGRYRFASTESIDSGTTVNALCTKYVIEPAHGPVGDNTVDKAMNVFNGKIYIRDDAYSTAADFKAAMDGVMLHYALATPTTTTIDPPLPMSYRVGAGGTERVMVASGTTSAPPVFATRYPLDPADLAASIAPRESTTAEANHAVGDLIMLGFTLCKVTTSIARGETITIGTNVTRTSVAAEIAALS